MSADSNEKQTAETEPFDDAIKAMREALGSIQTGYSHGPTTSTAFSTTPAGLRLQKELVRLTGDGSSTGATERDLESWERLLASGGRST